MKMLHIQLDDELAKVLEGKPNKSEFVRNALNMYKEGITTDTIPELNKTYKLLQSFMKSKFEYYDEVFARLDKLINMLETRM